MRESFVLPPELKDRLAERIARFETEEELLGQITREVEDFLLEVREKRGLFYEFLRDLGYQGYIKDKEENNYQV